MAEDRTRNKWAEMTEQQKSDYIDAMRTSILNSKRQKRFAKAHDQILAEMKNNPTDWEKTRAEAKALEKRHTTKKRRSVLTGWNPGITSEGTYNPWNPENTPWFFE